MFLISGFADEIHSDFKIQLETVKALGMENICIRSANGKSIADYSVTEFEQSLLPLLKEYNVKINSIGSPIGKTPINNDEEFEKQLKQLDTICKICNTINCKYIRTFSFYMPPNENANNYFEAVYLKIEKFVAIAEKYNIILLHENETGIFGDKGGRCVKLIEQINSPYYKAIFDFGNFVQAGEDVNKCWEILKPYVLDFHIKDVKAENKEIVVFGQGNGNVKEIIQDALSNGFKGPFTLEPHLVIFDSLSSLETKAAADVITNEKAKTGMQAYKMQYDALMQILL